MEDKKLSGIKETAEFLKMSITTVYKLTQLGKINAHRVERRLMFDLTDLGGNWPVKS